MNTPHFHGTSGFLSLFNHLLNLPTVSSANPALDQSNLAVINLLAEVFEQLGFSCELIPVSDSPPKSEFNCDIRLRVWRTGFIRPYRYGPI